MTNTQGRLKLVIDTPHSAVIETAATGYAVAEPCRWGSITDSDEQIANARRLVACWNACEGLPIDELEKSDLAEIITNLLIAKIQRNDLLEALKRISGASMSMYANRGHMLADAREIAQTAIAKAEGSA